MLDMESPLDSGLPNLALIVQPLDIMLPSLLVVFAKRLVQLLICSLLLCDGPFFLFQLQSVQLFLKLLRRQRLFGSFVTDANC
ncbi:hypothetical protein A471_11543 [Ectopseudomonas mendocina DLHK]|nr:hypothetical protein A471_11543 [Pseudomonas mendocina DLHK]